MEKQKNNTLGQSLLFLIAFVIIFSFKVYAQSPTPTASNTVPSLLVPSTSITITPTATVTEIATPTPTPVQTPKVDAIVTVASVGTQYPWNKRIPIKLSITPSQSGSKLEVRWQKKAGLVASPTTRTILNPQVGRTYVVSFVLTPYAPGYQRAVADLILTTNTTNYVSSKDIPLQLDAKKVVLPITMTYRMYQVGMYLLIFLLFFVALPFAVYQLYLYIKKYLVPRWLEAKIQSPV